MSQELLFLPDLTNFEPVACQSHLDLTILVSVPAPHFCLDLLIFAPGAYYFRSYPDIFARVARHFRFHLISDPLSIYWSRTPTPPNFGQESPALESHFGIKILCFLDKKCKKNEFTALHHVLLELFKKSILQLTISFCVIFFTKNKVVP